MRKKRCSLILWGVTIFMFLFTFTLLTTNAAEPVTLLLDGEVQKEYTTLQIGETLEAQIIISEPQVHEIQWTSENPDVVDIHWDQDIAILETKEVGVTMISAVFTTEAGEYRRDLLVYTSAEPEQMVYLDDELDTSTDEEYVLAPRAAGDITMYIDGEVRRTYNTAGLGETRDVRVEVEGETIQNIEWSSGNNSIVTISGNQDGAIYQAISEGVTTITAKIQTNAGNREKSLIITTRSSLNLTGYANADTEMHQAANEESSTNGDVYKGDKLDIRAQSGKHYWIYHDDAYGFVLKSAVDIPAVSLSIPGSVTMEQGKTYQLKAELLPVQATDQRIVWSTSDKRIITVNNKGLVTGVKEGKAYITVKTHDGKLSAKCEIIVEPSRVLNSVVNRYIAPTEKPSYSSVQIQFQLISDYKRDVRYYLKFVGKNKSWNTSRKTKKTNSKITHTEKNLDFNTEYDYYIMVPYDDNSGSVLQIGPFSFKTKNPKVSLSLKKQNKSSTELKLQASPSNFYDSYRIRYKQKGKKYSTLSGKTYSKKGNTIKVNKKLPVGKVSYFEISLYKKKKLICSDTVKVQKGYTTVTTKIDSNLSKINVKWNKVDFAKGYEVYRSEKKGKLGKKIKTIKKSGTTNYSDLTKNLKNPQEYYYQVRPYWKEGKKKKTGSSNRSRIEARAINKKVNNAALKEKLGMGNKLASGGANVNKFFIPTSSGSVFPAIKYQFDGKKLTIHLYIKYSSYEFTGNYYTNSKALICDDVSINYILGWKNENGQKYVETFEKGLKNYLGNQLIKGSNQDFGANVNFKTALVIHREDNKSEKYETGQKFIEVMIGGIDKYQYNIDSYRTNRALYWYHARTDTARIYMPTDGQVRTNKDVDYRNPAINDYAETAAHEMGHILGLADGYYHNGVDRCDENIETCIKFGKKDYRNMMKSNDVAFVANDFEMMLKAYKDNDFGGVTMQYYKKYGTVTRSEVIIRKADHVKNTDY